MILWVHVWLCFSEDHGYIYLSIGIFIKSHGLGREGFIANSWACVYWLFLNRTCTCTSILRTEFVNSYNEFEDGWRFPATSYGWIDTYLQQFKAEHDLASSLNQFPSCRAHNFRWMDTKLILNRQFQETWNWLKFDDIMFYKHVKC